MDGRGDPLGVPRSAAFTPRRRKESPRCNPRGLMKLQLTCGQGFSGDFLIEKEDSMEVRRCPSCGLDRSAAEYGWRDKAHTRRQSTCRTCMRRAVRASKARNRSDGREHLRNHYDAALTLCGQMARADSSHYFDEPETSDRPACRDCLDIDEQACIEADRAQGTPRGPFDTSPYRSVYLAAVARLNIGVNA